MPSPTPSRPSKPRSGDCWVALLRGVNVGGPNRLQMSRLVDLFEAHGCADARTYIQSGNVVFRAKPALAARLPSMISRSIREKAGFESPVILRSASDLERVARTNPFLKRGAEPRALHVAFLAETPAAPNRKLDPDRSPGDEFVLRGAELFLHMPNGLGQSKITNAWLDRSLGTVSTIRNWKTVLALLEMCRATV